MGKRIERAARAAWAAGLILCLVLAGAAGAAEEPPAVSARVLHSQDQYAPGGAYPLAVELTIAPGYHINSDKPSEPDLFPSKLVLAGGKGLTFSAPVFPPAKPYQPAWLNKPILVLDGRALVRLSLTVAKDAQPGQRQLTGKLQFQACDDASCLMPEDLELSIPITVAPAGAKTQRLNPDIFR